MDVVVVGRFAGAHGVAGEVRVASSTDPPENIAGYRPWLVGGAGSWRKLGVLAIRPHGEGFVVRLEGVTDRDAAQGLAGCEIAVPRSMLPQLDAGRECYWQDLIGLAVSNADGTPLGVVESLIETGAHDVLVISDGARTTLVPFADPFLLEVDLAAGRLQVDWRESV